jgi:hypothetical protein
MRPNKLGWQSKHATLVAQSHLEALILQFEEPVDKIPASAAYSVTNTNRTSWIRNRIRRGWFRQFPIVEAYHLPELTVCVECFDEEAGPELEEKKADSLMFDMTVKLVPKASCETY